MIPANEPLRAGRYKNLTTGQVHHYCNCPSQPQHLTLRTIAANRANYERWPAPAPKPPVQESAK